MDRVARRCPRDRKGEVERAGKFGEDIGKGLRPAAVEIDGRGNRKAGSVLHSGITALVYFVEMNTE